jgi:UDP-glucose 4-epimerase
MLSNETVGVFGANSFIGRHIVRSLNRDRIPVIAFGRQFPDDFFQFVGDVDARVIDFNNELEDLAAVQNVSQVIHLINTSNPAVGNKRVVSDLHHNVLPHVHFIQSCIESAVQNFIFISSGGTVYGDASVIPIPETQPADPLNSYALAKRVVEQYLAMLARGTDMRYTILRLANPYGPGQLNLKGQGLIPTILQQQEAGLPLRIFGNGQSQRDYVYIDDVVEAIKSALSRDCDREIVNIGSGQGRTILEVLETIESLLGVRISKSFVPARPTDPGCNVLDISKAKRVLGWEPKTSFADGICRTLEAHGCGLIEPERLRLAR